jgi:predicted enzyme related to lactoylglutathione lyase
MQMPPGAPVTEVQPMASGMTTYFWVDSIEEATARIEGFGGKTVLKKTEQGSSGYYANLIDIEGNRFGIYQMRPEFIE